VPTRARRRPVLLVMGLMLVVTAVALLVVALVRQI
jgi:hypothetical protein